MNNCRFAMNIFFVLLFLHSVAGKLVGQAAYKDAVFVAMTKPVTANVDPVNFDHEGVDVRGSYDRGNCFYAYKDGLYFVSLSAGTIKARCVAYPLHHDDDIYAILQRDCVNHNGIETISRDIIVSMKALQSLRMVNTNSCGLYSDLNFLTSLSLFRLTDLMSKTCIFSVARHSPISGAVNKILSFPHVLVNEGFAYDASASTFKAPQDGIYFFSLSVGLKPKETFDSILRANVKPLFTLENSNKNRDKTDTISRAGIHRLSKGDLVYVNINKTSNVMSDLFRQTSFSGFLYEPVHGIKRAWHVAMNTSWNDDVFVSPLPLKDVVVNEGSRWRPQNFVYDCDVAGIYYLTFSVGTKAKYPVHVSLQVDGQRKASIIRTSNTTTGSDMMSRSLILHLANGSRLYLGAEAHSYLYSTRERQTSFSGFLLFPHEKGPQ